MTLILTSAQMRAIEAAAIAGGAATGRALMERAGTGVVTAIEAAWPALADAPGRAAVLAGPGNNGGDGFVVARLLAARGWRVEVLLFGEEAKLAPDAAANCAAWRAVGGVTAFTAQAAAALAAGCDLVVDALFGTGLTRPVEGALAEGIAAVNARAGGARVVAVDMPSGLCSDSGRVLGTAVAADLTVSFHAAKCGHYLADGPARCGALRVAGIGLAGAELPPGAGAPATLAEAPPPRALAKTGGHKYGHGHALILSGGPGRGGAARLAARGALRLGAGLVTIGCPPAALQENAARLDAVMLRPLGGPEALAEMLQDRRLSALCLGPGLGGAAARALVPAALAPGRPVVLDADALTAQEDAPDAFFARLHGRAVLTPHDGEFARLFPDIHARLSAPAERGPAFSRLDAARAAAARAGCTVLLKGPDTVIAAPDGCASVNAAAYGRAAPWLATAGAGDVLAGLVTGLLARGAEAPDAARDAAWLHVAAARRAGAGLIAEDLPEALPGVFADLGL